jgi:plastocyanin
MKRIRLALAAAVAVLVAYAAVPAVPAVTAMSTPKLVGTVGPGFTIKLKRNGQKVTTLKAGKYTLVVSDKASIHNFVLEGKGFEKAVTTVPFTGTKTVTVTLKKGKYEYYCQPHETQMHGDFKVT